MLSFALVLAHEFSSVEDQLHVFVVRLRELFILGEDYVSMLPVRTRLMMQFFLLFGRLGQQVVNQANCLFS